MSEPGKNDRREKLPWFARVSGRLSFVPLFGVVFGIVALVWGLRSQTPAGKKLALRGAGGITITIVLYGGMFWFVSARRGVFYKVRARAAEMDLTSVMQAIEFYKVQTGAYPSSLEILRNSLPPNPGVNIFDWTDTNWKGKSRQFYYAVADRDHYYLLSVGSDGQPFTADDLMPRLEARGNVGLLIKAR